MKQCLAQTTLLVRDYDEAIGFYVDVLGFNLINDIALADDTGAGGKRWVLVAPPGATESRLLLAQADGDAQAARIGDQTGGRVFLFLTTDDFWRDYEAYKARGVRFAETPRHEAYGTVAVFEDLYGNKWDLIEPKEAG